MTSGTPVIAPVERILRLRALPGLDRLPQVLLNAVAQRVQERLFRQGNLLIAPDHPVAATYVVVDGRVTSCSAGIPGAEVDAGEAVGFLELLAQLPSGLEARAASDTFALELDADSLTELCDDHFSILHAILQHLALQLSLEMARLPDGTHLGSTQDATLSDDHPLDLVQRVLALAHEGAFGATSPDALVELARHAVEVRYDKGEVLWRPGDESRGMFLLTAGTVYCESAGGRRWSCDPTIALGLHEAFAELPRTFSIVAGTGVTGLDLPMEPVLDILEDHPELGMDVMTRFARRLLAYHRDAQ